MVKNRNWIWTIVYAVILITLIVFTVVFFSRVTALHTEWSGLMDQMAALDPEEVDEIARIQGLIDNSIGNYRVSSILAYLFSLLCLTSFGLILKHSGWRKEKQEKAAIVE